MGRRLRYESTAEVPLGCRVYRTDRGDQEVSVGYVFPLDFMKPRQTAKVCLGFILKFLISIVPEDNADYFVSAIFT